MVAELFERLDAQKKFEKDQSKLKILLSTNLPRAEEITRKKGKPIPYKPVWFGPKEAREIFEYTTDLKYEERTAPFTIRFEQTQSGHKSWKISLGGLPEQLTIGYSKNVGYSSLISQSPDKNLEPVNNSRRATYEDAAPYMAAVNQIHEEL